MASIDKRPDGRWRARWREYPSGPQLAQHFPRKVDAERFLVDLQHRMLSGSYTPPSAGQITVRAFAADWTARRSWAPATHDRIERELRLHILPTLGDRPLNTLRRSHVEAWANALPLAESSARMVYETLSSMLSAAVDDERLAKNPARGARLASPVAAPFRPLELAEVRRLAAAVPGHMQAAVVVAAGTGLRQGELFGLSSDRVDLERQELRIDRQLWTPARGAPFLKPPKSRNSYRRVALSKLVVEVFERHLETFGPGVHDLVFHISSAPVSRAMASKYLRSAGGRIGVPARWHDLRHHHATLLLAAGVNPSKVADRLGHDLKTLLATYAHVLPTDDDRVRTIVDASLGGSAEDWLRTEAV